MDTVKKIVRNVKEVALDYDDVQLRVRDATSNDPVGADERLLARLAHDTRERSSYNSMFSILWKRITDLHQPSHILKSLILTEYLLIHGDDRFVRDMRTKKNVVKRLTGYKFYRNHEDVGGEVRNQARVVLELLVNEGALEKMRKDRDAGVLATKTDRYERNYGNTMRTNDSFADNSPMTSPQQKPQRFKDPFESSAHDTPTSQDSFNNHQKLAKKYSSEGPTNTIETKKKKKSKKKLDQTKDKPNSFASSLSEDDEVEHVTKGVSKLKTSNSDVDLVTNHGTAPVDWLTGFNFNSAADQQQQHQQSQAAFPALSFESGGQVFQGTPIDPATPKGSPEQDGFAFDDALEIGSDDDNDKGFWNVDKKLVDLSDLNAHNTQKKPQIVTGTAPGKTLAEIAAANRGPAAPSSFAIHPLPSQSIPQHMPFIQLQQQQQQQQQAQHFGGYGQSNGEIGFSQIMPISGVYHQQMPYNGANMGYGHPANTIYAGSGNPFAQQSPPLMQQQQQQQQPFNSIPFQNPTPATNPNPFQKQTSNSASDPFAGLWKP